MPGARVDERAVWLPTPDVLTVVDNACVCGQIGLNRVACWYVGENDVSPLIGRTSKPVQTTARNNDLGLTLSHADPLQRYRRHEECTHQTEMLRRRQVRPGNGAVCRDAEPNADIKISEYIASMMS